MLPAGYVERVGREGVNELDQVHKVKAGRCRLGSSGSAGTARGRRRRGLLLGHRLWRGSRGRLVRVLEHLEHGDRDRHALLRWQPLRHLARDLERQGLEVDLRLVVARGFLVSVGGGSGILSGALFAARAGTRRPRAPGGFRLCLWLCRSVLLLGIFLVCLVRFAAVLLEYRKTAGRERAERTDRRCRLRWALGRLLVELERLGVEDRLDVHPEKDLGVWGRPQDLCRAARELERRRVLLLAPARELRAEMREVEHELLVAELVDPRHRLVLRVFRRLVLGSSAFAALELDFRRAHKGACSVSLFPSRRYKTVGRRLLECYGNGAVTRPGSS